MVISVNRYKTYFKNMNNFHYAGFANNPKNEKNARLLQQLKMIDRELEQDHKKLAQRKKLEEEFYEDSNRMNLADEVMNELLNKKPETNVKPINASIKPQMQYEQMRYFSPPANQIIVPQQNRNFNMPSKPQQIPRTHEIVNKRQLQKMKLQNQNAQQEFPFGGHSRDKDRKMRGGYENPTRLSPEKEYPIKNNYVVQQEKVKGSEPNSKVSNPFVKNDQIVRQKREEQQKQYRRLLQEQMEQQKRRKQAQKQKYKEQLKQKFNNYTPATNFGGVESSGNQVNVINENVPKKRRDPNAQYTSLEKPASQIRPSDLQYFKMQAQDLKNKMKKGRINFQQYQQQIKKLQAHYKCKVQDFPQLMNQPNRQRVDNESLGLQKGNIDGQNNSEQGKILSNQPYEQLERKQNSSSLTKNRNNLIVQNTPYDNANNRYDSYPNTSVPIESIAQRPQLYPNYSNYHPQGPIQMPNPQADYQMQMMFKLLDQFKNIFKIQTQSYSTDKKVLQEALTKMIPNVNPIMMTQQIPATQLPQLQKQFHTQAKKMERFDNFPKNNIQGIDYSAPQSSESEISSSYIQKSMSGIVNKIPLTKKQREEEKGDCNKDMTKFYERKYKVKNFKGFQYQQVDNQSSFVIPSVSNFMQTKNSQNQLSQAFEKDLKNYKRLQKERQMVIMMQKIKMGKVAQAKSSPKKVSKTQQVATNKQKAALKKQFKQQMIKEKPSTQQNPFLKKHISNDSNYGQQPQMQIRVKQSAQQNIQNFHSPNPKSQILEQQQYQTQPKKGDSPKNRQKPDQKRNQESTYQPQVGKDHPSSKLMNIMKANNQILAKYQMTPPHNPNPHIGSNSLSSIKEAIRADTSSKELSSREYFSGHEISPVQRRQYESSLQTVRSQQESAKCQRKNNMDLLVMGSAGSHSNFSSDYHPRNMMSPHSVQASPTIQSIQIERRQEVSRDARFQQNAPNITGYSQTVESISENSSRLPSFNKPPNNNSRKNGRTVSKKKESVVKLGNSGEGFQKSGLSGIPSQGSRQKSSEREGNDNLSNMQAPKFDSAVYESAYEQSQANLSKLKKVEERKQNQKNPPNVIQFPNAFRQPIYNDSSLSRSKENMYRQLNQIREPMTKAAPKLRSLEQARKIAREYKQKAGQEHNRSSVEQKLSQLQSIVQTNKKDESLYKNRREQPQTTNKKKDIMKILDGLEEQDQYEPDFESYREESEK